MNCVGAAVGFSVGFPECVKLGSALSSEWNGYLQILKIIRVELIPMLLISYLPNFP